MLSMRTSVVIVVLLSAMLLSACASSPTPTPIPALPTSAPTVAAPATALPLPSGGNEPAYPLPTVVPPTPGAYPRPEDPVAPGAVDSRSPVGQEEGLIIGQAPVEAIEVLIRESAPVQVSIRVEGYLPDGCTELAEVTQMRDGQRLIVELATVREAEAMCTQALVPFELDVPIDLSGLEAGAYTIDVNGVQATLTLDAAMLAIGQ